MNEYSTVGSKFENFWWGNSGEMERGSVSNYSEVSETTGLACDVDSALLKVSNLTSSGLDD